MKIIDCHTHFYPTFAASAPEVWAASVGENYWGKLVGKRPDGKKSLQGFPSEKKFLLDMDNAGVEKAVIQGWYWVNPKTCEIMNSQIAKFAAAHPDRISAFAAINPACEKESLEILRRAKNDGFIGVGELHDGVQNFDFCSESFGKICAECAKLNFPICVHLTEKSDRQYLGKCATDFKSAYCTAKKYPDTKFIFAHFAGGDALEDSVKLPQNVFFDTAAFQFTNGKSALSDACLKYPDRAMFGSDYPLRLYPRKFNEEEMSECVSESRLAVPADCAKKFFCDNFESLFAAV